MSEYEIRAPREEEFPVILALALLAFGEELQPEDEESYRLSFPFDRGLCAYEDGRMVATSAVLSLQLTLPGGSSLAAGGVTWVSTLPTHRRRGLLRRLMAAHFDAMVERAEPLSVLLASEGNIYGRFGYGPATLDVSFSIERPYAVFASPVHDKGRVVLLDTGEASTQLPAIYERNRLLRAGTVSRPADWWPHYLQDPVGEREGAGRMYHVMHETAAGTADGYVSYRIKDAWSPSANPMNEIHVVEVVAGDRHVHKALWDYIFSTDLCQTICCGRGWVDEPLRWLMRDSRRFEVKAVTDALYVRLLDIPRALSARTYGAAGELVLEVPEVFPSPEPTRYLLRTGADTSDRAECGPTSREPDLELRTDHLAAAYLGGVSFHTLAMAGWVRELTPGALVRADAMFATPVAPFCATMF